MNELTELKLMRLIKKINWNEIGEIASNSEEEFIKNQQLFNKFKIIIATEIKNQDCKN